MHVLTISTLYPNNEDPKHGIFVENRRRQLQQYWPEMTGGVIAPVPWFPFKIKSATQYNKYVDVLSQERRHNIEIMHPRYLVIPKIGMYITPWLMALSLFLALRKYVKAFGKPDVIDGHYYFPDGLAISLVARYFDIPFTCTARGTDLNLIADMPLARRLIQAVIGKASKNIAVCQALTNKLSDLGASSAITLRNGVDLDFFSALDSHQRKQLRNNLLVHIGADVKVLLSVGWLIERKGHYLIIEALAQLPNAHLLICGDGPEQASLQRLVDGLHLSDRVTFTGGLSQSKLRSYYQIADALVLASSREGWANVLLESMACGTPVVATNIWGTPEVVQQDSGGVLCERSVKGIVEALRALLNNYPEREAVRQYAERFDWDETSAGQQAIFETIKATGRKS